MELTVDIKTNRVLDALMKALGPEGRHNLLAVAAQAVKASVQAHVQRYAHGKHFTAHAFGGRPTGHYEKGSAAITFEADPERGLVHIPIPGISRAYQDIEITPTAANRLTVPVPAGGSTVYGRTVGELRALGWRFFTGPKGHESEDCLFGTRGKGKQRETKLMFVLKTVVHQGRDPSLLPSMRQNSETAAKAMLAECKRIVLKARGAAA